MEDESYKILSDLDRIEKILKNVDLQDERARQEMARLFYEKEFFEHKIGMLFLRSLVEVEDYNSSQYKNIMLRDCERFAKILYDSKSNNIDKLIEWESEISKKGEALFESWIQNSAISYINSCLESEIRKLYVKRKENQEHDKKIIEAFSVKYDLEKKGDADKVYQLLVRQKGNVFQSEIGYKFVENLQTRTSKYKKRKVYGMLLGILAGVCMLIEVIIVFPTLNLTLQEYSSDKMMQELDDIRDNTMLESAEVMEVQTNQDVVAYGESGVILKQYRQLYEINHDLVGWFGSEGLGISYPVLQCEEEEDFYLSHNFYKEPEQRGSLFIDATTCIFPKSGNIVVYGHNMNNGDMFGNLEKYKEEEFYHEYPTFNFDTIYETGNYQIVAVMKTHILKAGEDGFRYYQFYDYSSEAEFEEFIRFIEENRLYDTGENISYGDSFVMLSTCEYSVDEGRFLVIGKKV